MKALWHCLCLDACVVLNLAVLLRCCLALQLHQKSVLSNSQLPFDPMQHFAALLPVATQQALDAAAAAAAGASPAAQQPQRPARAPVPLLGEATAPVLGTEEPAVVPRSSERTGGRALACQLPWLQHLTHHTRRMRPFSPHALQPSLASHAFSAQRTPHSAKTNPCFAPGMHALRSHFGGCLALLVLAL